MAFFAVEHVLYANGTKRTRPLRNITLCGGYPFEQFFMAYETPPEGPDDRIQADKGGLCQHDHTHDRTDQIACGHWRNARIIEPGKHSWTARKHRAPSPIKAASHRAEQAA
jgi:hypothetical protein